MLFTRECIFKDVKFADGGAADGDSTSRSTADGETAGRRNFAKDPAVVRFKGVYYLYFSTCDEDDRNKFRIGIATSSNLEDWEFQTLIPLENEYEKNGVAAPGALVRDGKIHLFYQTYGNGKKDAICHAYSEDGIHFVRNKTNPIFAPSTDWCCGRAIDADVVEFKDKVFLYFATRDHAFETQMLGVAYTDASSDFSRETWTQGKSAPVLRPSLCWEKKCIEAPATVVFDGRIVMFYGGAYNCEPQQIGVAMSDDGIDFKRLVQEPYMKNGKTGEWNESESGHPYAFRDYDGNIYLFYQGSPDKGNSWYLSQRKIDAHDLQLLFQ